MKINNFPQKAKINLAYCALATVTGLAFILAFFIGFGILSLVIGLAIGAIGIIYIVVALKDKREVPENDSVLGITVLLVGLMFMMPGITEMLLAYVPLMVIFLGLGILIELLLRKTLKKGEALTIKGYIARIIIGASIATVGGLLFLVQTFSIYSSIVTGVLFIGFSIYGTLKALGVSKLGIKQQNNSL